MLMRSTLGPRAAPPRGLYQAMPAYSFGPGAERSPMAPPLRAVG